MTQTLPYLLAMSAIASQVVESRWVPDLQKRFSNADPSPSADKDTSTKASEPKTSSEDKKTTQKAAETKTESKKADPTTTDKKTTKAEATTTAKKTDTTNATPTSSDAASSATPTSINGAVGATPVVSNTASASPTVDDNAQKSSSGASGGTIGAIVAVVVVVVLGAAAFFVIRRRKRRNNLSNSRAANMQKQDPFTMGYGNQDPMPYQDNNYAAQNNAYAANNNTYMMETTSPVAPVAAYNNTIPNNEMYNSNPEYASYDPNMGAPIAAANTGYHDNNVGYTDNTGYNNQAVYTDHNNAAGYNPDYTNTAAVAAVAATAATVGAGAGMIAANNNAPLQDQTQQQQPQQQQATEHTPSIGKYTVVATFVPTLSDELDIEVGDQVELIVEYDDGWCQGINASKGGNKGVFPRHCIDQVNHAPVHTGNVPDIERTKRVSSMYIN